MKKAIILEVISALLILLFLYAAISKFLDWTQFMRDLNNQPFPNWMTSYLLWIIPVTEVLIVLFLIFERTRTAGFWASLVLMLIFSVYAAAILMKSFDYIPCSCGGVIKGLNWKQHLVFNLFFVTIAAIGIRLRRR